MGLGLKPRSSLGTIRGAEAPLFHVANNVSSIKQSSGFNFYQQLPQGTISNPNTRIALLIRLGCAFGGFFQVGKDFDGVAFGFYFGEDVLDFAVRSDDEGGAGDTHHFFAVHIFLLEDAVGFGDFLVGVGEQGKGKLELILKFLLRFGCVGGDSEKHGAGLLNLSVGVAEGAGLDGATWSIGAGIEVEDNYFAAEIFERNLFSVLIG